MRSMILALGAASLAVPAAVVFPIDEAQAQRTWRGKDGRVYCRKSDGTVGLIVGGVGGALVGRAIDTRGDRAVGTLAGAAAGALIGREVARKRRCR